MRDWTDQPEAAGPGGETTEADFRRPHPRIGRIEPPYAYPGAMQADAAPVGPDAVDRTLAAEARADFGKTVPEDTLDLR